MRFRPPPPSHVSGLLSPSWQTSLYVICVAQATAMLAFGFVLPFLPLYLKEIGVSPESAVVFWSGALVTSTGVSLAIFSPIWGALADRHGRKLMVLRSMLIGGLIIALMGLVQNVEQFLALRILQGVFTGTIAAATALVAGIVPRERLAWSMGLLQTSVYVGISAGPVLGGLIAQAVGIRGTFFVAGAMLAVAGIFRLAVRPRAFHPSDPDEAARLHRNNGHRTALADPDAADGDPLAGAVELGHRVSHLAVVRRAALIGQRPGQALRRPCVRGNGGIPRAGRAPLQPPRASLRVP